MIALLYKYHMSAFISNLYKKTVYKIYIKRQSHEDDV